MLQNRKRMNEIIEYVNTIYLISGSLTVLIKEIKENLADNETDDVVKFVK